MFLLSYNDKMGEMETKKILLKFYSCGNLGDDLFVKIFSDYFNNCRINLIVNPRYFPICFGGHVKIHLFSILDAFIGKALSFIDRKSKTALILQEFLNYCQCKIQKKHDAAVWIGGSLFMGGTQGSELEFQTEKCPEFAINSNLQNNGNSFIIGANLGPVYSPEYWDSIKAVFRRYNHVCLRDYSSYCMVKELSNVQYAPDVIFLTPKPKVSCTGESVVISVIDICRHTTDKVIISAYYGLLADAASYFADRNVPVTLVSFCEREGDEAAILKLLTSIPDNANISTCFYKGDIDQILKLFAGASFIVGSRFHSVILGFLFEKPVFPIVYNCKTTHYLSDLQFGGKYATLKELPALSLDDLIYNYKNHIIVDCSEHIKYAENQFWGLRQYLKK